MKIKILEKWKYYLEILSYYTSLTKIMIIHYTAPEIWFMTDVIVIFQFQLFFAHLPHYQHKKSKFRSAIKKNMAHVIAACQNNILLL